MINTGGAALDTIIAAGAIAIAGKVAGLFDSSVEFNLKEFIQIIGAIAGVVAGIVGIIPAVSSFFH